MAGRGGYGGRGGRGGGRGGGGGGGGFEKPKFIFRDPGIDPAPDNTVLQIENAYMNNSKGIDALAKLGLGDTMPLRPAHGTTGERCLVWANYYKLSIKPGQTLWRYHVDVLPVKPLKAGAKGPTGGKLQQLIALLLDLPEFASVATEYKAMIISAKKLEIPDDFSTIIKYRAEGQEEPRENAEEYTVRVVSATNLDVDGLVRYLGSSAPLPVFQQKLEIIQALNAVMGHYPRSHSNVVSMGSRHFDFDHAANKHNITGLGGGIEAIRGFVQSVRPATGGLLINVNTTHAVFLEPRPMPWLLQAMGSKHVRELAKKLSTKRMECTHLPMKMNKKTNKPIPRVKTFFNFAQPGDGSKLPNPPKVKIHGAGPKDVEFWKDDASPIAKGKAKPAAVKKLGAGGRYISVFEYFRTTYPNIKLDPNNRVINVGTSDNPNYLPSDVCVMLPGQIVKRRLSPEETQGMIKFACRHPQLNANSITNDGTLTLGLRPSANKALPENFGLRVNRGFLSVAARVLAPPQITYGKGKTIIPRNGSWNLAATQFHDARAIGKIAYIYFALDYPRQGGNTQMHAKFKDFEGYLNRAGMKCNLSAKAQDPKLIWRGGSTVPGQEQENWQFIREEMRRVAQDATGAPKIIFVVLPVENIQNYNMVKTIGDTELGVHTICCTMKVIDKPIEKLNQVWGNLSMKVNLKLGGINQILPKKLGIIDEGKTMVVGLDVTHPSPGSKESAPSVAAIVASVDKNLGQWPGDFKTQTGKKEMVEGLDILFRGRLDMWQKKNKTLPSNIIIYRDGVSEGQYQLILDDELPLIRNTCRTKYPADATKNGFPHISIIVCGKRHHTRFYPVTEGEADNSSNCRPGTIVDRGVTEVANWDFFLQPHACLQGTARSCHYYVILDEIFRQSVGSKGNAAQALEELTHNMCHLFGRATKAVSLCPPAYYADILCTRVRCYLAEYYDPAENFDGASVTSGGSIPHLEMPPQIKDTMYYV